MSLWRKRPPVSAPLGSTPLGSASSESSLRESAALGEPVAVPGTSGHRPSLGALLDLVPHPLLALDRDGTLRHANETAQAQIGDALPALLRNPALGQALRTLLPGGTGQVDVQMDVPVRRTLRVSIRCEGAAGGAHGGSRRGLLLLSVQDRSELEAVERMRSDFIANASHELRTPLASLIGFIETLQGPAADDAPARIRFLSIMAGQATRMRRLIDNLLSLSRIQMHEHERPSSLVSVAAVARRVADAHEPLLAASGHSLSIDIAAGLPPVAADADQLSQVLTNFLDNAVKYAGRPDRPATIVLSVEPARAGIDPQADGVVLAVTDDGPGIAPQHVPRLTERFYRIEDGPGGKVGSGLGLAIVKHIVGRHGGRLTITSTEGQGARFAVWLPRAPVPATAAIGATRQR
ncbi:HAMP domain-containing histidine kinase [Acetobacteraceae bacterium KSS8]|uniref:histidine kinase n=1 Tax=Endosaccharibacter trunci TaxID=2812733 RepID=A0ABT1W7T4_9PROT|nr:HAMP domain-containing histidine kinase [Acetobacteraceae bacterium KSS8]